ncbi:MAG: hypothetical protein O7G84_09615 [Gammaproteobacteria bacterium]|nr:hypothetical protein [Gammaproteobacteria bacterium]
MGLWIIIAIAAFVGYSLVHSMRQNRTRWLKRLALPGTWECERDGVHYYLELRGELTGGRFEESWIADGRRRVEQGSWVLHGNDIRFDTNEQHVVCHLRLFEEGRIGIHGPGRERRIYEKHQSNVVPLRRRH